MPNVAIAGIVDDFSRLVFAFVNGDRGKELFAVKGLPGIYRRVPDPMSKSRRVEIETVSKTTVEEFVKANGIVYLWQNRDGGKGSMFAAVRDRGVEEEIVRLYRQFEPEAKSVPTTMTPEALRDSLGFPPLGAAPVNGFVPEVVPGKVAVFVQGQSGTRKPPVPPTPFAGQRTDTDAGGDEF